VGIKKKVFNYFYIFSIILVFSYFIYINFYRVVPTCFDNIKNGDEEGIDCGGACTEVCSFKATDVNVFWARTFPVAGGVSNMAALIENPNFDYILEGVFNIKIYDDNNIRLVDLEKK